jgi:hypothetical protein
MLLIELGHAAQCRVAEQALGLADDPLVDEAADRFGLGLPLGGAHGHPFIGPAQGAIGRRAVR